MKVWICGKYVKEYKAGDVWEFGGVFKNKRDAIAACKDHRYFIGPAILGKRLEENKKVWPGAYYPKAKDQKEAK